MLNKLDSSSQVCDLLWSLISHELVSTHGFLSTTAQNQIYIEISVTWHGCVTNWTYKPCALLGHESQWQDNCDRYGWWDIMVLERISKAWEPQSDMVKLTGRWVADSVTIQCSLTSHPHYCNCLVYLTSLWFCATCIHVLLPRPFFIHTLTLHLWCWSLDACNNIPLFPNYYKYRVFTKFWCYKHPKTAPWIHTLRNENGNNK